MKEGALSLRRSVRSVCGGVSAQSVEECAWAQSAEECATACAPSVEECACTQSVEECACTQSVEECALILYGGLNVHSIWAMSLTVFFTHFEGLRDKHKE